MEKPISPRQLQRLQVLYGQMAAHTGESSERASRLAWAAGLLQRQIASFKELTIAEGTFLIDTLQGQLGVRAPMRSRRHLSRDAAHKAGTEGRRNNASNEVTMASSADIARIQYALNLLGWNQAQLDAWLRSPRSPLSNKASGVIRTLKDANRVWWALKNMAKKQGKWKGNR